MNLDNVFRAAKAAVANSENAEATMLYAANSMPLASSDFDRGIAAGMALALFLEQTKADDLNEHGPH